MKIFRAAAALLLATVLAGCGRPLGTYRVRNVTLVPGNVLRIVDPVECAGCDPGQLLRIEFTSKTDLYEASDGGGSGLYVYASFCPYDKKRAIYVAQPYYDDRPHYDPITHQDIRPMKDPKTGDYVYTTYIGTNRTAQPARSGQSEQIGYDLRRQPRDLCLRINHPDYVIIPSRSRVFTVPAAKIQNALMPHERPKR